ncbi:hypothetical protein PIB30_024699 [Stylosanthes scabra]|uniref:Protein kinase domain-containing protein n=1 Tax=Stylosanthes scabra TaxID=79078 RepID=A0ABU6Q9G5_9FABA|nr:hypothetical protein [Stylosanthes scabra]
MGLKLIWVPSIFIISLFLSANSEEQAVKKALVLFMKKLAPDNNAQRGSNNWGWNLTSDPCTDHWHGVTCHSDNKTVMSIVVEHSNLKGVLDASSLSMAKSLMLLSLKNNSLHDSVSEDIGNLKSLTLLYLNGNRFSGKLPVSIGNLPNLMRLDVSDNNFSGEIPEEMSGLSQLKSFLAENNNFTGSIPNFELSRLQFFNVSNNNLHGHIPDDGGKFFPDSFYGNPGLCGKPLANACPPAPAPAPEPPLPQPRPRPPPNSSNHHNSVSLYLGYIILCFLVLVFLVLTLVGKFKTKDRAMDGKEKTEKLKAEDKASEAYYNSSGSKSGIVGMRSESSISSLESGVASPSGLVVLSSAEYKALRFEDLLGAPAELVRRGKNGSLYKVMMDNGVVLAVKRVKDCGISKQDFQRRMEMIAKVKHPRVLPPLAYYCSHQEKLLVHEYMHNGSLFMLLYGGSQSGGRHHSFGWRSRLNMAANTAAALAHMHENLRGESGVSSHGNLKSSNILFDNNMNPLISEYGLPVAENNQESSMMRNGVKGDIYAFGVILLELLTGKVVTNDGFGDDLAKWVNSVVREEWTVEVFDKSLIREGASEERMMSLLQVALNCITSSPNDRPSMDQVAMVIRSLKEDEEKSVSF